MQRRIPNSHKAGASNNARPAVCPSGLSTGRTGTGQDLKIRALFDVLGHSIARFPDGSTVQVTPDALKIVPFHEGAYS